MFEINKLMCLYQGCSHMVSSFETYVTNEAMIYLDNPFIYNCGTARRGHVNTINEWREAFSEMYRDLYQFSIGMADSLERGCMVAVIDDLSGRINASEKLLQLFMHPIVRGNGDIRLRTYDRNSSDPLRLSLNGLQRAIDRL